MAKNTKGLEEYYKKKTEIAINKVNETIEKLQKNGDKINFNIVSKESGVAKTFLYDNPNIKEKIALLRNHQINKEMNQRAKFDKTSKSKDAIIEIKDRKIAKLEKENEHLKNELNTLRGLLYNKI